jgi:hypothetical protein
MIECSENRAKQGRFLMSGTLASPGAAPETAQNPVAKPAKPRKPGCGCLGSVSFAIMLVLALLLLLNPWSLHMGGRWTPALTWHGVGQLHSTTGAGVGRIHRAKMCKAGPRFARPMAMSMQ